MSFNSIEFLIYFVIVCAVYFVIPKRIRYIWLLIASYFFYMNWSVKYSLLLLLSTAVTYASGIFIDYYRNAKQTKAMKWTVAASFVINLGILAFFKYGPFLLDNLNTVYGVVHHGQHFDYVWQFALPVGISFYTFQALSYTMDVYRGEVPVEKNFFRYALFVSFFPQLVSGPIERSGNLLKQIQDIPEKSTIDYERITRGLTYMMWGFFLKMVIADRAAIAVNYVWADIPRYGMVELTAAAFLFALQVYCDFSGYSAIAIGGAQVLGFTLMENFEAPFLSESVKEFWNRFHISLNTWFRDYLFYPMLRSEWSKNLRKKLKKSGHKYWSNMLPTILCTAVVWFVSGLWHGADWAYVLWGVLTGAFLILEETVGKKWGDYNRSKGYQMDSVSTHVVRKLFVLGFYAFTMIFFRAGDIGLAKEYLRQMFTNINPGMLLNDFFYEMSMTPEEVKVLRNAVILLIGVGLFRYYKNMRIDDVLAKETTWFRWICIIGLFVSIWVYGVYGPYFSSSAFVYFQF